MRYFVFLLCLVTHLSCVSVPGNRDVTRKGRHNTVLSVIKPFLPQRIRDAYRHTLYNDMRSGGDCQPNCPGVDIWQYQYLGHTSPVPISTQKAFWKSPNEARVIAFSLFGTNPIYYLGLLDFLKSFQTLKRVNHISDRVWGMDSFIPRIYVPKGKDRKIEGELKDEQIKALLDAGCEIVYVDNGLKKAGKDGTFWRFMVAAEPMPEGQKIRYLVRDADWVMTAAEAFAIGEWMASPQQYHRSNLLSMCLGPLNASTIGGSHTGKGSFTDLKDSIEHFPYRMKYGDDEMFLRDAVWPKMKASGSVLTHVSKRDWKTFLSNPYEGSCEEPTKYYCNALNPQNQCEDVELFSELNYPQTQLGLRASLADLEKTPDYFDMKLDSARGQKVRAAFTIIEEQRSNEQRP